MTRPRHPKNVLLICVDTLRADALAPWAKGPPHMPLLSREMARGVVFRNATSTSPWTAPSVASILTGLLPSSHGAQELSSDLRLVPAVATLGEMLDRQGYRVAAFTGGGWVGTENGMLQGFEHVQTRFSFRAGATLLVESQQRLKELAPWFVLLHTFEAHDPYLAPPPWMGRAPPAAAEVDLAAVDAEAEATGNRSLVRRFLLEHATRSAIFETAPGMERMRKVTRWFEEGYRKDPEGPALVRTAREAYEKGLARLDRAMTDYLRDAEAAGLLADTFVAIVGDHGEGFGEHGTLHHGRRVYEELVHVPMSIRGPGLPEGLVVDGSVSTADLVPTLLELVRPPDARGHRRRLAPARDRGRPGSPRDRRGAPHPDRDRPADGPRPARRARRAPHLDRHPRPKLGRGHGGGLRPLDGSRRGAPAARGRRADVVGRVPRGRPQGPPRLDALSAGSPARHFQGIEPRHASRSRASERMRPSQPAGGWTWSRAESVATRSFTSARSGRAPALMPCARTISGTRRS